MSIATSIIYISIVFWLLPPFRQYRGSFFAYFLILAISDPLAILAVKYVGFPPHLIHAFASIFLWYSLNADIEKLRKFWILQIIFISLFVIGLYSLSNLLIIVLIIHLLILLKFIKIAFLLVYKSQTLNIFYLALIFYELSAVINLLDFLGGSDSRFIIYYMTLSFQILIAIFFTIFTENSKRLMLKLKPTE